MQTHILTKASTPETKKKSGTTPFFQAKLTVNTPGDVYEQEADQVADQVMRMKEEDEPMVQRKSLTPVSSVQRMCADCEEKQEGKVQRQETTSGGASGQTAPSVVGQVLSSGGGRPMDRGTQQFMERRFGQDFGQVRIHTGGQAAESAAAIQAKAYTSGKDIVFGEGEYRPESGDGKKLLAHELVHVGQQGGNRVKREREKKVLVTKVNLRISWMGKFDDDKVNKPEKNADVIVHKTDAKGEELGKGSGDGSISIEVKKEARYFISVKLSEETVNNKNRYGNSSSILDYKGPETADSETADQDVIIQLPLNRWNIKNMEYTWRQSKIDPEIAGKVKHTNFFGKKVLLNELVISRAEQTNKDFLALPESSRKEITNSIAIVEGAARRTTNIGGFSNHSLGTAIDMNYNLSTKQNAHLFKSKNDDKKLLDFLQKIVRLKQGMESFNVWEDTGQKQLDGSEAFKEEFPIWLRSLMKIYAEPSSKAHMEENKKIPLDERSCLWMPGGVSPKSWAEFSREVLAGRFPKPVFSEFSSSNISTAITAAKKIKKTEDANDLQYVNQKRSVFKAWVEGEKVNGVTLAGAIPIHEKILELMLKNGWSWGGDWSNSKDYMHFEDKGAIDKMKLEEKPKKKTAEKVKIDPDNIPTNP